MVVTVILGLKIDYICHDKPDTYPQFQQQES